MEEITVLSAMILYLIITIGIGFAYAKTANENSDNYFLGGRSLGPFVTAMSAEASDMSGWLLMGLPGVAYFVGLADAFWTALGLGVGTYLNWLLTAKRLRIYSHVAEDSITIPDYFSKRFQEDSPRIMTICALFILIFFTVYASSCFVTVGKLFSSIFGFHYQTMMIIGAIFVVVYTYMGGFLAESVSDFMQSIVMIIALACTVIFGVQAAGGFGVVLENIKSFPGFLEFFQISSPVMENGVQSVVNGVPQFGEAKAYGFLTIVSTLSWGLGYFGVPQVLLRFMAIRHAKEITLSRRIATVWVLISLFIAVWIGLIGRYLFPTELLTASDSESIFIHMANMLMPAFVAGIMMAGILAATMSSSDSYLLIASSAFAKNLYQGIFRREARDFEVLRVSKITLTVIAIIAVVLALDENSVIFQIVSFAWAGFGATFGPIMIISLFWREATKEGAFAGIITGGVMVFVWKLLLKPLGGIFGIYELLPAFLLSLIVIVVVSKVTPKDPKVLAQFDEYQREVKAHLDF
ncbi:MAG: sodium/proline symporter [Tissierellia bacterium]|nr:sodium/proline symporter [Tissierellia bacterium]